MRSHTPLRVIRQYSTHPETQPKISSREKAELVSSSFKSIFDGFLTSEETYEPVDIKPILAQPRKFVDLHQFHRDQVIEDLEKRFKQPWKKVPDEYKRLSYFISYANYGVREELTDNLYANVKPEDLPFAKPSKTGTAGEIIRKLPEVDLWQASPLRQEQFRKMTRRLDPLSKTVVYLAALIALIALYRDKTIGEDGMVIEIPESALLLADLKRNQEREQKEKEEQDRKAQEEREMSKKWYYLWLK
jgi:hypothetical protein